MTLAGRAAAVLLANATRVARGREPHGRARRRGGRTRCPVAVRRAMPSPSRSRDRRNPNGPCGQRTGQRIAPAERSAGRTRPPTTRLASTSNPVASQATTSPPGRSRNRITLESSRRNAASTKVSGLLGVRRPEPTPRSRSELHRFPGRFAPALRMSPLVALQILRWCGPTAPASAPRCRTPPMTLPDHRRLGVRIGQYRAHLVAECEVDRTQPVHQIVTCRGESPSRSCPL